MESYPHVTRETIRELDHKAIEEYQIPGILLMENAGAAVARIIMKRYGTRNTAIFCGTGKNGGDGFVIARHLYNHHVPIQVFFVGELSKVNPNSDSGINLNILKKMWINPIELKTVNQLEDLYQTKIEKVELVVDAVLGTGLTGNVREPVAGIIAEIASWKKKCVAVDIPSGLDANNGEILGVVLPADLTVTFGLPKKGFLCGKGPKVTGEVVVAEISLPRNLLEQIA